MQNWIVFFCEKKTRLKKRSMGVKCLRCVRGVRIAVLLVNNNIIVQLVYTQIIVLCYIHIDVLIGGTRGVVILLGTHSVVLLVGTLSVVLLVCTQSVL